jgi:transposase
MNRAAGEVRTFVPEGTVKADFVIASIEQWRAGLSKPTVLVLDNARIDHSLLLQSELAKWEEAGLYIFYLPAYSLHLNRIERLWLFVNKPIDYQSLVHLQTALETIWSQFGQIYQINFK